MKQIETKADCIKYMIQITEISIAEFYQAIARDRKNDQTIQPDTIRASRLAMQNLKDLYNYAPTKKSTAYSELELKYEKILES